MKKIFPLVLGALLCAPVLSGCTPSDAHKTAYQEWVAFKTDTAYSSFVSGNITYSTEIEAVKSVSTSPFYTLTYHEHLIHLCFQNVEHFISLMQITPDYNKNQTKKLSNNVIAKINDFKKEVESFNVEKANLEKKVDQFGATLGNESSAALGELEDFMLDIGKLTLRANALQVAVNDALQTLYFLPVDRESAGDELQIETALSTIQSTLIDDYVTYSITKQNGVHPNNTNALYDSAVSLNDAIETRAASGSNYETWLSSYRLFISEEKMFSDSLNHVNLLADNTGLTGQNLQHYQKVQNFVNENAYAFTQKTITMLF